MSIEVFKDESMARSDEGEFELILGNRQLLLVFGVLVLVLGVFFTMGYIVGRNNPSQDAIVQAQNRRVPIEAGSGPSSQSPIVVDPSRSGEVKNSPTKEPVAMAAAKAPEEKPKLPEVPVVPKDAAERPLKWLDAQVREKAAKVEPAKVEPPKKETPKAAEPVKEAAKPKEPPKKETPRTADLGGKVEPSAGTYLQVVSVDKAGAESMVSSLRNKSFSALVAPGANPTLFRVLVGPLSGKEALAKAKIDLEKVGIKGAFVKKY